MKLFNLSNILSKLNKNNVLFILHSTSEGPTVVLIHEALTVAFSLNLILKSDYKSVCS